MSRCMTKNKTKWCNVPSEDSDQHGHLPSLIRVFTVRMKKALFLSYPLSAQWRLWSDWADAQADLRLHWAHSHFVGFVMRWLISSSVITYVLGRRQYPFWGTCPESLLPSQVTLLMSRNDLNTVEKDAKTPNHPSVISHTVLGPSLQSCQGLDARSSDAVVINTRQ